MPDLTMKCELSVLLEIPKDKPLSIFEDSVISDKFFPLIFFIQTIDENCLTSGCNFAMDCTTVCHLMSSTWESHLYNYEIPIIVKPVTNQGKGILLLISSLEEAKIMRDLLFTRLLCHLDQPNSLVFLAEFKIKHFFPILIWKRNAHVGNRKSRYPQKISNQEP